eukprot:2851905-Pyramimonas_sp.AAC.1
MGAVGGGDAALGSAWAAGGGFGPRAPGCLRGPLSPHRRQPSALSPGLSQTPMSPSCASAWPIPFSLANKPLRS